MKIFKNGVGRPSNKTLRRRNVFYIGTVIVLIVTMLVSGFLIVTKFNGSLNSDDKNAKLPGAPKLSFYVGSKISSNIYKPGVLGDMPHWTNKNVIVVAKSNAYSVEYELSFNHKTTIGKGKKITISDGGTTSVRFKACDKKKNCSSYTKWYFVSIDKSVPIISFDPSKSGTYVTGSVVKASCRISGGSGVASISCWETQNSKNKVNKSLAKNYVWDKIPIKLSTVGSNRTVTCTCSSKAGNSSGKKVSPKFKITPRH